MGYTGQLPPELSQPAGEWAEASADLAAVLRLIDYGRCPWLAAAVDEWIDGTEALTAALAAPRRPQLRLINCRARSHARPPAWRNWLERFRAALYRVSGWGQLVVQAVTVHPGFVTP